MLAAIINKNENLDPKIFETIEKQSKEQDEKSLTLAVWVTKAMLLKGAKALDEWIDRKTGKFLSLLAWRYSNVYQFLQRNPMKHKVKNSLDFEPEKQHFVFHSTN